LFRNLEELHNLSLPSNVSLDGKRTASTSHNLLCHGVCLPLFGTVIHRDRPAIARRHGSYCRANAAASARNDQRSAWFIDQNISWIKTTP
jgi:hypothetical protein